MIQYEKKFLRFYNQVLDSIVFVIAFFLGILTRYFVGLGVPLFEKFNLESIGILFFVFFVINHASLYVSSAYPMTRIRSFQMTTWTLFKAIYGALIFTMALAYMVYPLTTSRLLLIYSSSYAYFMLLIKEAGMRRFLRNLRKAGYNLKHVILIGDNAHLISLVSKEINANHLLGLTAVGVMTYRKDAREVIGGQKNLGIAENLLKVVEKDIIDCVIFLSRGEDDELFRHTAFRCEQRGIELWVRMDIMERRISRIELEYLHNMPFINFRTGPENAPALFIKYSFDKVASFILLIMFIPLFILVSILIKLTSRGPVFFKQYRAGVNGRKFVFYKFRSMVDNADEFKHSLRKINEMKGPVFKSRKDPRITPFGRFIRKYSLDELPQLWNVLKGDMSLVGPRPLPVQEAARIHGWKRRRFSMKPGITCLWQVEGRNKIIDFEDWVRLDLKYIDQWRLWLDFVILMRTIPVVIKGTGV